MIVEFPYIYVSTLIKDLLSGKEIKTKIDASRRFFFMLQIIDLITDTSFFLKKMSSYLPVTNFSMTLLQLYIFSDSANSLLLEEGLVNFFNNDQEHLLENDDFVHQAFLHIQKDPRFQDALLNPIKSEELYPIEDSLSKEILRLYLSSKDVNSLFEKRRQGRLSLLLPFIINSEKPSLPPEKTLFLKGFAHYLASISP